MDSAFLRINDTASTTRGAVLVVSQLLALLRRGFLQSAGRQPLSSGVSHLFHLGQVHVQTGALFAKSSANQDFSPLFRKLVDAFEIGVGPLPCCHGLAVLELREVRLGEFPFDYPTNFSLWHKGGPALGRAEQEARMLTRVAYFRIIESGWLRAG
jgi:hypothetical protein